MSNLRERGTRRVKMLKAKKYHYYAFGICFMVFAVAFFPKVSIINDFAGAYSTHLWNLVRCLCIIAIVVFLPRPHGPGRLRSQGQIMAMAFSCAVFFLALQYVGGFLLKGIVMSGYDRSPVSIVLNLWNVIPMLVMCELARAYMIGTVHQEADHRRLWIVAITLLLAVTQINFTKVIVLKTGQDWFIYIVKDVLPCFSKSCLLTVLVYCGGVVPAIVYVCFIDVFFRVFPLLPSLPWVGESALGIAFPAFAALFVGEQYRHKNYTQQHNSNKSIVSSGVLLVIAVALLWFVVGVFPVYPSVVLTGSMEPGMFPGDVVLIEKIVSKEKVYSLKTDDIINFQREDVNITHRIIAVHYDQAGNISFETKGDNNSTVDPVLVMPNDINGIVNKTIPKIGLPVIWLRISQTVPEGVVN